MYSSPNGITHDSVKKLRGYKDHPDKLFKKSLKNLHSPSQSLDRTASLEHINVHALTAKKPRQGSNSPHAKNSTSMTRDGSNGFLPEIKNGRSPELTRERSR